MSNTEETNERTLDSEANAAQSEEETQNSAETSEQDTSSTPAPAKPQAILYGTRKRRPGASATSTAKTLDQVRGGPIEDDEEILMDDLVVKSTAPSHLVGNERSSESREREPRRRERGERRERRKPEPVEVTTDDETDLDVYSAEEESSFEDLDAYPKDDEPVEEERPERFAARKQTAPIQKQVEEFRPSQDGKRAEPRKRVKQEDRLPAKAAKAESKGFFAWLKSLFVGEEASPKTERRSEQDSGNRRRRGSQGRRGGDFKGERSGERGGNRQRRGRRPQAEGRNEKQGEGGNRRRRRPRRPQGERRQSSAE